MIILVGMVTFIFGLVIGLVVATKFAKYSINRIMDEKIKSIENYRR